jgi:hypothetical protein
MIARSFRYYVEGILAVYFGQRVLLFMKENGLSVLVIVATVVVVGLLVYLILKRWNTGQ